MYNVDGLRICLWTCPRTDRLHYTQTSTASNIIMGITSPTYEEGWMMSLQEKKMYLGSAGVIRAGGPGDNGESDKGNERPVFEQDHVPACWHSLPQEFWEEMIHSFSLKAVFIPTVMDDHAAMACIMTGTPAVLMLFSEGQRELLRTRLLKRIWEEFRNPQSKLHEVGISTLIGTVIQRAKVAKGAHGDVAKVTPKSKGKWGKMAKDQSEEEGTEPKMTKKRKGKAKQLNAKAKQSKKTKQDTDEESVDDADSSVGAESLDISD